MENDILIGTTRNHGAGLTALMYKRGSKFVVVGTLDGELQAVMVCDTYDEADTISFNFVASGHF